MNSDIVIPCQIVIRGLPFDSEILTTQPIFPKQENKILSVTIKDWPYDDWRQSALLLSDSYLLVNDIKYNFRIGYTKTIQSDFLIHNGWREMEIRPFKKKNENNKFRTAQKRSKTNSR
jgi:hypothetical protein